MVSQWRRRRSHDADVADIICFKINILAMLSRLFTQPGMGWCKYRALLTDDVARLLDQLLRHLEIIFIYLILNNKILAHAEASGKDDRSNITPKI